MHYFAPLFDSRSYTNLLYLIMSFPLGLIYFIVLVTGLSMGLALSFILIGLPLLAAVIVMSWMVVSFERILANTLLGTNLPILPTLQSSSRSDSLIQQILGVFRRNGTLKGIVYLFAKFPFGIFGFVAAVTTLTMMFSLLAAPFLYTAGAFTVAGSEVTNLWSALVVGGLGLLIAPLLLRITNGITHVWGRFTVAMLAPSIEGMEKQKNKAKRDIVEVPDPSISRVDPFFEQRQQTLSTPDEPSAVSAPQQDPYFNTPTPHDPRSRKTLEELLRDNGNQE